jgi:hypothetical protein
MILITIFVELRVVAGRSRRLAGSPQAVSRRPCCAVALRRTAWSEHGLGVAWAWQGMASVKQTRPHWVNQMGKTHSKPLAARHGRGTAWERHGHGMGTACCVNRPLLRHDRSVTVTRLQVNWRRTWILFPVKADICLLYSVVTDSYVHVISYAMDTEVYPSRQIGRGRDAFHWSDSVPY